MIRLAASVLALAFAALVSGCGGGDDLILATTTSTQDSGLLDVLIPRFEDEHGFSVKTIAVGSGQALRMGEEGEADVILSHSPEAEEAFVAAGHAESREPVMYNDFVIVGPGDDPAGIAAADSAAEAFSRIAAAESAFISRGDGSGTHAKELGLWEVAGVEPAGSWYTEAGLGMGAVLSVANDRRGYTLSDRGTFLAQAGNFQLEILFEGDEVLFNQYHVIVIDPERHSETNVEGARAFDEFIRSEEIQDVIRTFGVEQYGQPLFVPNANEDQN